ncbi:MAG: pyridoxamine 5'-phosphate oxidase family protein [bacterium]
MSQNTVDEYFTIARELMKAADYCFFITQGERNDIHSRLMHPFEPDQEFNVWLGASPKSRKVHEVLKQGKVTLSYLNPRSNAYVTLLGTATIETSQEIKHKYWRAYWSDMYPGGPENTDYIVIKITPYQIEMMNFKESALPQPYSLKPLGLTRVNNEWALIESMEEL